MPDPGGVLGQLGASNWEYFDSSPSMENVAWGGEVALDGWNDTLVVSSERRELSASRAELADLGLHEEQIESALASGWQVSVEARLSVDDPAADYHRLIQVCHQIAPSAAVVIDCNMYKMLPHWQVCRLANMRVPPPVWFLFQSHFVTPEVNARNQACWAHTHGLERCGLPELEILDVPRALIWTAGDFLNEIAEIIVGRTLTETTESFDIGPGVTIGWEPWFRVVRHRSAGELGGAQDRAGENEGHRGRRLIIGRWERHGLFRRRRWVSPLDLLQKSHDEGGICYVTVRETERRADRALQTWSDFCRLYERYRDRDWEFDVKLGFCERTPNPESTSREHLWFSAEAVEPNRVLAKLKSHPHRDVGLRPGDVDWFGLEFLSDWMILYSDGTIRPHQIQFAKRDWET